MYHFRKRFLICDDEIIFFQMKQTQITDSDEIIFFFLFHFKYEEHVYD